MVTVENLIGRGYLPGILPPPFNSDSYGHISTSIQTPIAKVQRVSEPYRISAPRANGTRRSMTWPNPYHQLLLAKLISNNWAALQTYLTTNRPDISISRPTIDLTNDRALVRSEPRNVFPTLKAQFSVGASHMLYADISNFYNSIYTHSIPWAIEGKQQAKANQRARSLGNDLDIAVRATMSGQTIGIPIGPDTSMLLAEIVSAGIDREFGRTVKRPVGFRYVDDYYLFFKSAQEVERALAALEAAVSTYELQLNGTKTEIVPLPQTYESPWVSELRIHQFSNGSIRQRTDLISYFSLAINSAHLNPNDSVLLYAVMRIKELQVDRTNWRLYLSLLLNCATAQPTTLSTVASIVNTYVSNGYAKYPDIIKKFVNELIRTHMPLGHYVECAWALWLARSLRIRLPVAIGNIVARAGDPACGLVVLDMRQAGLIPNGIDVTVLQSGMSAASLYTHEWLLSYEPVVKGWLAPTGGSQYVARDPFFKILQNAGVQFYDESRSLTPLRLRSGSRISRISSGLLYS